MLSVRTQGWSRGGAYNGLLHLSGYHQKRWPGLVMVAEVGPKERSSRNEEEWE